MPEQAIHHMLVLVRAADGWSRWRRQAEQTGDFSRSPEIDMLEEAAEEALAAVAELASAGVDTGQMLREGMPADAELVAMCASCKRVRTDKGGWASVEAYLQTVSHKMVTHGLCEPCAASTRAALAGTQ